MPYLGKQQETKGVPKVRFFVPHIQMEVPEGSLIRLTPQKILRQLSYSCASGYIFHIYKQKSQII